MTKRYLSRIDYENPNSKDQIQPYTNEKYRQFKTGVTEESKNINVFKYQTAYMNNQVCH